MKTIQELDEERNEHQQMDADELMSKMFSFIPLDAKHPTSAIISAKFCAKVVCDYLMETLPNINDTPPNSRKEERYYGWYWKGVKLKLEQFKASAEKNKNENMPEPND